MRHRLGIGGLWGIFYTILIATCISPFFYQLFLAPNDVENRVSFGEVFVWSFIVTSPMLFYTLFLIAVRLVKLRFRLGP